MREFRGRLSVAGKVGVIAAFLGYLIGIGAVVAVSPIAGPVIFVGSAIIAVFCVRFFFGQEFKRSRVLREGPEARATIISVMSTCKVINRVHPEIEML